MNLARTIKEDIGRMKERFPKLILLNYDGKPPSFEGILDVCDERGEWYGSFDVRLIASDKYPHGIPRMFETGGLIERIPDRHVNSDGSSCVAMEHVLLYRAVRGLSMNAYLQEFAWPYFANQLYFKQNGYYTPGEYAHGFKGVEQFYNESLGTADPVVAIKLIIDILNQRLPSRNDQCVCGSLKKYKNCHMKAVNYLQAVGNDRLMDDLAGFKHSLEDHKQARLGH
ncbi:SEC-C domain-containing protein [Pedobacter faecalis]|uniref:SEC-C domain-containing protein n=1 Tax=Pedobacter faecalis TaxID=3041495 RepID=UPI00254E2952|nr:SEC-C domain-containing protein [Pedobacter sp. ELA7]